MAAVLVPRSRHFGHGLNGLGSLFEWWKHRDLLRVVLATRDPTFLDSILQESNLTSAPESFSPILLHIQKRNTRNQRTLRSIEHQEYHTINLSALGPKFTSG